MRSHWVTPNSSNVEDEGRRTVPDFEIRYFHADGTLAVIRMTKHGTREEAEAYATHHQHGYARFEVREPNAASRRR